MIASRLVSFISLAVGVLCAVPACSSDADSSSAPSTLERAKKLSAATSADLPLVCDAWAAGVGGYGKPAKTESCGSVTNTARPPESREACVASLQSQTVEGCTASLGNYVDCKIAIYAKPCATLGEAPGCSALYGGTCWR